MRFDPYLASSILAVLAVGGGLAAQNASSKSDAGDAEALVLQNVRTGEILKRISLLEMLPREKLDSPEGEGAEPVEWPEMIDVLPFRMGAKILLAYLDEAPGAAAVVNLESGAVERIYRPQYCGAKP